MERVSHAVTMEIHKLRWEPEHNGERLMKAGERVGRIFQGQYQGLTAHEYGNCIVRHFESAELAKLTMERTASGDPNLIPDAPDAEASRA